MQRRMNSSFIGHSLLSCSGFFSKKAQSCLRQAHVAEQRSSTTTRRRGTRQAAGAFEGKGIQETDR
jgi:hypothetical protein